MRMDLAGGWHLLRVEVNGRPEWIICDPIGDRLGGTDKHKTEFDEAMAAGVAEINRLRAALRELADNPFMDPEGTRQFCLRTLGQPSQVRE